MSTKIKPTPFTRHPAIREWNPQPLKRPTVHPQLLEMDALARAAEVTRYGLARAEYWLSPEGWLREWWRRFLFLAAAIGAPAALLVPIITFVLTAIAAWVGLMVGIVTGLVLIAGGGIALFLVVRYFRGTPRRR